MNEWENLELPGELQEVATHLRDNRHMASAVELDELKRRAMSGTARPSRSRQRRSSRLVTSFLLLGLTLSAASAGAIAGTSGSSGGQPTAAISQYQVVAGERVVPGSARLLGPTGCAARAFSARVSGQNVAKVVFTLDGKKLKTLTAPNAGTQFTVRINPARMKVGVHRIVATVTFKPETKKAPQSYRISFQRCAKKLAAPRFTG